MKQNNVFEMLGMSADDETTYRTLVNNGPATITDLARKTGLFRQELYRLLPALIKRGIIKEGPKGKRRIYVAESPDVLLKIYRENQKTVEYELEQMKHWYQTQGQKPIVTYREGKNALKYAYHDTVTSLPKGGMYFRYSSRDEVHRDGHYKKFPSEEVMIRDEKQLQRLIITNEKEKKSKRNLLGRDIRVVPKDFDLFEDNVAQIIYGDKVAIIDINTDTAITIEHPVIARFQEKLFRLLFRYLKP
ncbi:MAG: hypothetical protein HZA95_04255 [Candidatus Vogelbacteria bacterium]|nr:hypothetical protein [Candidatus Vogelbacteria bacterium]